jgi:hypothetical protein
MGKGANPITEQRAAGGLDLETLRRAYEQRGAELVTGLYANDAEVLIINHATPPSSSFDLHGREEIREHLRDGFSRQMLHRVENEVVDEVRIAFNVACRYPDGNRVFCRGMLEVRDGKIVREVDIGACADELSRPPARQKQNHSRMELRP